MVKRSSTMARRRSGRPSVRVGSSARPGPVALLASSALLGVATGLRSQIGVAAVIVGPLRHGLPARLRSGPAKTLAVTAAAGELVVDKLPAAPARTEPLGVAARVVLGAGAAVLAARASRPGLVVVAGTRRSGLSYSRRSGGGWGSAAGAGAVAGASALASAHAGYRARVALARRCPGAAAGVAVAVAEDATAVGLASLGCRAISGAAG